jgi:hypothetical protein
MESFMSENELLDQRNRKTVYNLIHDYFDVDKKDIKFVKDRLFSKEPMAKELKSFKFDSTGRRRFKVAPSLKKEYDKGWRKLVSDLECRKFITENDITYDDFHRNSIKNMNGAKFFKTLRKHLLKKGEKEEIIASFFEEIGTLKIPKDKELEIVISINFVDWFLCSTSQQWSSCLNLESDYSDCYWGGLPGLLGDPNRIMVYVTDGNKKDYNEIKNVDKIISRSWALLDKNLEFGLVRWYPNYFNTKLLNRAVGNLFKFYIIDDDDEDDFFDSFYPIVPIFNHNGDSLFIYQDYTTFYEEDDDLYIKNGCSGYHYYSKNQNEIDFESCVLSYKDGLNSLILRKSNLSMYTRRNPMKKCSCGTIVPETKSTIVRDVVGRLEQKQLCDRCVEKRNLVSCIDGIFREKELVVYSNYSSGYVSKEYAIYLDDIEDYVHQKYVYIYSFVESGIVKNKQITKDRAKDLYNLYGYVYCEKNDVILTGEIKDGEIVQLKDVPVWELDCDDTVVIFKNGEKILAKFKDVVFDEVKGFILKGDYCASLNMHFNFNERATA